MRKQLIIITLFLTFQFCVSTTQAQESAVPLNFAEEEAEVAPLEEKQTEETTSITNKIYNQLPPEDQERLINEANTVFEYCSNRQLFSQFHDCRCVASKFMDERIQNPDLKKRIIGVADKVASQCPNGPGTAGYGYKQCRKLYKRRMDVGLEDFCTCYANTFAALYKEDPRAFMPHITKISAASLVGCDKKGMTSPLNPDR